MKPTVGRWVHWNADVRGGKLVIRPALIVQCKPFSGSPESSISEQSYDVMLEVHGVIVEAEIGGRSEPCIYIVEHAPYSPARSGHESAIGCWTWPPRES